MFFAKNKPPPAAAEIVHQQHIGNLQKDQQMAPKTLMEAMHAADGETCYWSEGAPSKDGFAYKLIREHRGVCREEDNVDDDDDVEESRLPLRRKKSNVEYSESNGGTVKDVPTCVECGKTFGSSKALYGHLRCHPSRGYRGANPPRPPPKSTDARKSLPVAKTWSVTARRGRKGTFSEFHGHELAAVKLLMLISGSKVHQRSAPPAGNRRASYTCATCNQTFTSHQALGGHRANHSKQKELEVGVLVKAKMVESNSATAAAAADAHRCKICNMTFPTGQALGGHKRKHRANPGMTNALEISKRKQEERLI